MASLDILIIVVYLAVIVTVGITSRGRQDDTRDYFTSGSGFGSLFGLFLVGLSIAASLFSGLSFVAVPSNAFRFGVTALSGMAAWPFFYVLMRWWFLPRYLAVPAASPYEIIERRLGRPVRMVASAMFLACRLCWLAAVIYVPALLLTTGGGLGPAWFWPIVLVVGLSSTFYTVVGGIRGVIVTDAIQFLLIVFVLIATILYIVMRIPLSVADIATYVRGNTQLLQFNWSLSLTQTMTVMAMVFGGGAQIVCMYVSDQMLLQRYLAAGDARGAASAVGTSIVTQLGVLVMLAAVGLTLGTWYSVHPDTALPGNPDQVFTHFVATRMPVGFVGLVLAAILAATMSSVTSGVNALSGALLNDFRPLAERTDSRRMLRYARVSSALIGLAATLGAGLVPHMGTLFNIMNLYYGIFFGPMLACMVCAVSRWRVNGRVLIGGMIVGCLTGVGIGFSPLANLWVSLASCLVTLAVTAAGTRLLAPSPELS